MARKTKTSKVDMYQEITDAMVAALESDDIAPWNKPWACLGGMPKNHSTGKQYRGVNIIILMMRGIQKGYSHSLWLTYKQAAAMGAQVRKGEKGTRVVFWNFVKKVDEKTKEEKTIPFLKSFTVFNVEQCDGIELPEEPPRNPVEIDETAEALCEAWPVPVAHGGDQAYYMPSEDRIQMPERDRFTDSSEYYSTRFHEMGHSTGHKDRLARKGITNPNGFGSHAYSVEELVAEFTASFLCAATGVDRVATTENSAAYLKSWASKIKADPKLVMQAAQAAQKASDAILVAGGMIEDPAKVAEREAA